ncbi:MAG: metallophosphoesterase [Phycisphaerales bacterium]|nr:MAG: metallophosphoesterase [Phycisphaerales bacterium]
MRDQPVIARRHTVVVGNIPAELSGLRIAHISDFHFHRWNRVTQAAQDLLLTADYDLVAATGDFGTSPRRWARAADLMRRFFEPIAQRAPIYAVLGNHDNPAMATAPDIPLVFLRNESVSLRHSGGVFELAGLDQGLFGAEDMRTALGGTRRHDFTILLAHYPSTVFRLPPGRVALQLSGHTHGGQIRLPYLGCIWANDRIPLRMSRGLHTVAGTILHTSPGIGVCPPIPVRINCPAEVTLLALQPAERVTDAVQTEGLAVAVGH